MARAQGTLVGLKSRIKFKTKKLDFHSLEKIKIKIGTR